MLLTILVQLDVFVNGPSSGLLERYAQVERPVFRTALFVLRLLTAAYVGRVKACLQGAVDVSLDQRVFVGFTTKDWLE